LHLAVAPTKSNDRFEWFIEKATEIGITEITPVICAHSERKMVKLERLERVAVAAMKQSLGCWLPTINKAVNFNDFIKMQQTADFKGIAHCTETEKQSLGKLLQSGQDCLLLIGPEGDFSDQEIDQAIDQGYRPVSLGTKRLRTETAAIVACHSVAFINDNL
jgi:16S rRNA (uracil1498-N3)-methyltransferase